MEVSIVIRTDNAAFGESDGEHTADSIGSEVARILRQLADKCAEGGIYIDSSERLYDYNGNQVGSMKIHP